MPAIIIGALQTIEVDIADTFNDNHVLVQYKYNGLLYSIRVYSFNDSIVYSSIDCLK